MKKHRSYLCVAVVALFLNGFAQASAVISPTFKQMFEQFDSDALVRAYVQEKEATYLTRSVKDQWGRSYESRSIYTRYGMRLTEVIHGDTPNPTFDVYLPGGTLNGIEHWVSASYELDTGLEVVLFVQWDEKNSLYYSAGTAQTVFVVQQYSPSRFEERDVLINFIDYQSAAQVKIEASSIRRNLESDQKIWDDELPNIINYDALKQLFSIGW